MMEKEPAVAQPTLPLDKLAAKQVSSPETGLIVCFVPCRFCRIWTSPSAHGRLAESLKEWPGSCSNVLPLGSSPPSPKLITPSFF